MVTQLINQYGSLTNDLESLTLSQAYHLIGGDNSFSIPFLIWLLEDPDSPFSLPGKIYLREHDFIHLLLNRGFSLEDEAYIIGFTMGNDSQTNRWHILIFKLFATLLYPKKYRFNQREHMKAFNQGFSLGKKVKTKNLNQMDFSPYLNETISNLKFKLGINNIAVLNEL